LTLLVGLQEGHPACKKTERWGAGMVICLERGAALHIAQLMPLPFTVSCLSKIEIGFTFLVPAHPGSPGQRAVRRVCVGLSSNQLILASVLVSTPWCQGVGHGFDNHTVFDWGPKSNQIWCMPSAISMNHEMETMTFSAYVFNKHRMTTVIYYEILQFVKCQ